MTLRPIVCALCGRSFSYFRSAPGGSARLVCSTECRRARDAARARAYRRRCAERRERERAEAFDRLVRACAVELLQTN